MTEPDDHELREYVRAAMDMFRAIHERQVLRDLEASLPDVEYYSWPPTPGTAHPYYEDHSEQFRRFMRDGGHTIATVKPKPIKWWAADALEPSTICDDIVHLYVKRAFGPAPYVGRPFGYAWRVAIDGQNRWVADEAERVWL